jgi:alkylated DNA nucleotide flippase Atl1
MSAMRTSEFVMRYPRLFHMTSLDAWPGIERHGLRSVTALLDLLYVDPDQRRAIEKELRPETVIMSDADLGRFEIRDQKPLNVDKLQSCLTDMAVSEWVELLNRKVFFWPTDQRVEDLLGALAYRGREHLVLVVNTESLLAVHESAVTLAPINTGSVLYDPPPRGRHTLLPIADYPFEEWRRRRGPRKAIAEVAVDYAVVDIVNHIVHVERRQHAPKLIAARHEPDARPRPAGSRSSRARKRSTTRARMDRVRAATFIAAIPDGRWTSYKEVATAAGNERAAQAIGTWLRRDGDEVLNVHRVIHSSGLVAEAFTPAGPDIPADAAHVRDRLRREGVRIDDRGRASGAQCFTVAHWHSRSDLP